MGATTAEGLHFAAVDGRDDYFSRDVALLAASFLCIFLYCYYYTVLSPKTGKPDGFGESTFISNLHSVPLCLLAFLSLKQVIPETIPICWSLAFFIVDLLDAVVRREIMWMIHALISLALNILTGMNPKHRAFRSVSKGFFAEASTPFLNHWKKSRTYISFVVFFIAFTLCRILWVPYFVYTTYALYFHGEIDYLIWPSILFYILQLAWFTKMCSMIFNYKLPKDMTDRSKER